MTSSRRILPASVVLALILTACGGSDSSSDTTVEGVVTSEAETESTEVFTEATESDTTVAAPVETEPAETSAPDTEPAETAPPATAPPEGGDTVPTTDAGVGVPAAGVAVSLVEWAVEAPTEYSAGDVTFTATNNGNFPHELVVIQAEGYESLPVEAGGAVIEDDLPTGALLGRTSRVGGGSSEDLTVTLAPGNYVLVCNLGGGANSHAGRGQHLDISVS